MSQPIIYTGHLLQKLRIASDACSLRRWPMLSHVVIRAVIRFAWPV